jgi:hypothetical protein
MLSSPYFLSSLHSLQVRAAFQEKETTQADRKASDAEAPMLRASLGQTIAKYFTTVRSVKDDQGTFLG